MPNRQLNLVPPRSLRIVFIGGVLLISGTTLLAWIWSALGSVLPAGWQHMKANTALLTLGSLGSLVLSERGRSRFLRLVSFVLAGGVFLFALLTFLQFFGIHTGRIDTLLAADPMGIVPGRPSIQACVGFMIMGFALLFLGSSNARFQKMADAASLLLCLFLLSFVGASFFTRDGVPGWSLTTQLSAQAFVCFTLLTMLVALRRTDAGGIFHIVLDRGIGGKTARIAGPAALILPFLIAGLREAMVRFHLLPLNYAIAIAPAITALLALVFILLLAHKNRELELAIQNLSLRDELTGVYNRRGFMLLAARGLREAQRTGSEFRIVFFDVDNLKTINDTAGHEDGSRLLRQFAETLQHVFRFTDIVGRLGGDEFVACASVSDDALRQAIEAVSREYAERGGPPLSFSHGMASRMTDGNNLDHLLALADQRMYEMKRKKKQGDEAV